MLLFGHLIFASIFSLAVSTFPTGHRSRQPNLIAKSRYSPLKSRQLPAQSKDVKSITNSQGVTIRYKEPAKQGVCETTPGINSYSGYIDLDENSHTFFWFFEARNNSKDAPLTLWLNGGPGSDSLIGLFAELGPCKVLENLTTVVNPYSWSEHSNLLFLSQPLGVGFSYQEEEEGFINPITDEFTPASGGSVEGRYPVSNASALDTTELCAVAGWHVLQGFYSLLPELDVNITSRDFHLWTESYGGHYGPVFYDYFAEQNQLLSKNGSAGTQLNMKSLGIGNGIINEIIQAPLYPEFAVNNTYGIKSVNDTVYNYMKFALNMGSGCLQLAEECGELEHYTSVAAQLVCIEAEFQCRINVEGPYYLYSGRGAYDIRHPTDDPTPPTFYVDYLNQASTQDALGVDLNYTQSNYDVSYAFGLTGEYAYSDFLSDLEYLLDNEVRVSLYYGDADYSCNWFGGEAVSKAVNYTYTAEFNAAGYEPFIVDGTEYGEVRQYGNFSFLRIYESGHEVPYYQPFASLEMFKRVIQGLDIATGEDLINVSYATSGDAEATHMETFVPLPT